MVSKSCLKIVSHVHVDNTEKRLAAPENHSPKYHKGKQKVAGPMQIINIQDLWNWLRLGFRRYLPAYDPFLEMISRPRTEIALQDGGFSLFRKSRPSVSLSEQEKITAASTPAGICGALQKGETVIVSVNLAQCFIRKVKLPRAALGRVTAILDLELARVTPFSQNEVYTTWIDDGRAGKGQSFSVEHIVFRKDLVADLLDAISKHGAKPAGFLVRDNAGQVLPLALSIEGGVFREASMKRWAQITLASMIASLLAALVFGSLAALHQSHTIAMIGSATAALDKEVAGVRARLDLVKANSAEIKALQDRKLLTVGRLQILEELSRILPDTAFADVVAIDADRIDIGGAASTPETLIAALRVIAAIS